MRGELRDKPAQPGRRCDFQGGQRISTAQALPVFSLHDPEPGEAQRKQVREGKQDRTQGLVQMRKSWAVMERPGSCPMTRMLRRAWDRSFSGLWAAALAFLSGRSVTEEDGLTFKHMRWGEGREAKTKKIKRNLKAAPKASILERTLLLNRLVVQVFLFLSFSSQCRPRSLNTLELELDKS